MKRTSRNPVASRQEIIEKSAPVFNVHGFEGAKVQMLIDATGFQKGGIYRHFTSKKDLAQEAFRYNYRQLRATYLEGIEENQPAKAQLLRLVDNFLKSVTNPVIKGGCPILNTAIEVDDTDKELRMPVKEALEDLTGILVNIIVQGVANKEFRKEVNPVREAQFIMALVEGSIMMAKLLREGRVILGNCDQLLQYMEHFIFTDTHSQTSNN